VTGPHPAVAATRLAVRHALRDITRGTQVEPGSQVDLVLVACSGGADSLALANAVAFEAPRAGLSAGAVIVDHNLQEGSLAVAERAAAQCRGLGLAPVEIVSVHCGLNGPSGSGSGGPEARARDARYGAFEEVLERLGAVAVLLGHTRDDQAEQVLLGLARGSGARSLSGMPVRRGPYVRPLLDVARTTTVAACESAGLTPWVDPHNSDPAYSRVRARGLLRVLETELGPGTVAALARSADLLREDADVLDDLAARAFAELSEERWQEPRQRPGPGTGQGPGNEPGQPPRQEPRQRPVPQRLPGGQVDAAVLLRLPTAIRTRVWRLLALEAGCSPGALVSTHIESLDTLVTCWRGQGPIDLPGHVQGSRSDGRVILEATHQVE
jgi:tRNA(Ile)-lysidine synthase